MRIRLDSKSDVPLYRQLMAQVRALIASGKLRAGERLPSVRELAVDLRINPNTVARAYRELDHLGVLETRGASGSFVSNGQVMLSRRKREEEFRVKLREALGAGSSLGIDPDLARELFDELADEFLNDRPQTEDQGPQTSDQRPQTDGQGPGNNGTGPATGG